MAGKEGQPQERRGFVENAARKGKKFSLITLPIGIGVGLYGIATANPFLARGGLIASGIDTFQIGAAHKVEKRQARKRKEKESGKLPESATIIKFSKFNKSLVQEQAA